MTTEEIALHIAQELGATKANKEQSIYRACIRMAYEQKKIDAMKFSYAFCAKFCSLKKRVKCDMRKQTCIEMASFLKKGLEE